MTTEDFERAQLRLDIDEIKPGYRIEGPTDPEEIEAWNQALQAYFERRD